MRANRDQRETERGQDINWKPCSVSRLSVISRWFSRSPLSPFKTQCLHPFADRLFTWKNNSRPLCYCPWQQGQMSRSHVVTSVTLVRGASRTLPFNLTLFLFLLYPPSETSLTRHDSFSTVKKWICATEIDLPLYEFEGEGGGGGGGEKDLRLWSPISHGYLASGMVMMLNTICDTFSASSCTWQKKRSNKFKGWHYSIRWHMALEAVWGGGEGGGSPRTELEDGWKCDT